MIKKIRKKFILIAMISASAILLIFAFTINIINYSRVNRENDTTLEKISREPGFDPGSPTGGDRRYFYVTFKNDGTVKANVERIRNVTEEQAETYATEVKNKNKKSGSYEDFRFLLNEPSNTYYFLDCAESNSAITTFALNTVYVSLGGLVAFFLVIFFSSKYVIKPIEENFKQQKRFITNASHELKTPLTIISANNDLMILKNGENAYNKNISKQIKKMNKMIHELISLSKINENANLKKELINFSEILDTSLESFAAAFKDKNIEMSKNIAPNIMFEYNPFLINQIISICLENALKYSNKKVNISLEKNRKTVEFSISNDTLLDLSKDVNSLTERFYRSNEDRSKKDGQGIGLSVLKEICELNNSTLNIEYKESIFKLSIIF